MPEKLDRCVDKVKGKKGIDSAYAVCNASIGEAFISNNNYPSMSQEDSDSSASKWNKKNPPEDTFWIGKDMYRRPKQEGGQGSGPQQGGRTTIHKDTDYVPRAPSPEWSAKQSNPYHSGRLSIDQPKQEGGVGSGIKGHTTAKDQPQGKAKGQAPEEDYDTMRARQQQEPATDEHYETGLQDVHDYIRDGSIHDKRSAKNVMDYQGIHPEVQDAIMNNFDTVYGDAMANITGKAPNPQERSRAEKILGGLPDYAKDHPDKVYTQLDNYGIDTDVIDQITDEMSDEYLSDDTDTELPDPPPIPP